MHKDDFRDINGSSFKTQLKVEDFALLEKVKIDGDMGYVVDLNPITETIDRLKNLMRHGLIRVDIFQDNEHDYFAFNITSLGNTKLIALQQLLNGD